MIINEALKGEKGVTLMVLVVSVIILLIISVVVITSFNKEEKSLIDTTEKQAEELRQMSARQKIEVEAEKIKLANVNTKNYGITTFIDDLQESLQKYDSNAEVVLDEEEDDIYAATYNNYTFKYYYDGTDNGEPPVAVKVARITSSPIPSLIGTEYDSLFLALKAVETAGLNASNNPTVIQLIANIANESNTIDNQNIILDLSEHTLKSEKSQPTITVQSGSLNVIDSENGEFVGTGTIRNTKAQAIKIETEGKFTIGVDDGTVSNVPIIQGVNYGVNNIGEFNFYDGIIKGTNAISDVEAQIGLPHLRSIGVYPEGTIQSAQLDILQKVEARIGKKEFVTLESAIEYANTRINTDGSQVTIQIVEQTAEDGTVSGITKNAEVVIPNSKNIIIDMKGLPSTFNSAIVNNGTLEIIDSVGNGKFVSTNGTIIKNAENAKLTVTSGTIEISKNESISAIENSGRMFVNGGKIVGNPGSSPSSNILPYGIISKGSGSLNLNGGVVDGRGGIKILESSTLVANSGATVQAYYDRVLDIRTTQTTTINGGTFKSSNTSSNIWGIICHQGTGLVKIENIDINYLNGGRGIYNELGKMEIKYVNIHDGGNYTTAIENWYDMDIDDIDISGAYDGIYHAKGNLNIENIDCIVGRTALYNSYNAYSDSKNITINGGTIKGGGTAISFSYKTQKLTLNNVNVEARDCAISAGSLENLEINGNTNITTTNVFNPLYTPSQYATIFLGRTTNLYLISGNISGNLYGIYRDENATGGIITIGTKNTNVNSTTPSVSAVNNYGIYSKQPINLYSGRITGYYAENQCGALFGSINEISDNYVVKKETSEKTQSIYLTEAVEVAKVLSSQRKYNTIQEAIANTSATDTIELLNGAIVIGTDANIEIPANKNIIIDFKGNIVEVLAGEKIKNSGTLYLKDSTATLNNDGTLNVSGALKGDGVSKFITNTGTLTIEKLKVSALDNVISSSGDINIKTSRVISGESNSNIIINGTANLNITEKAVVIGGYTITNEGTGDITIENGIVRNEKYFQNRNLITNKSTGNVIIKGDSELYSASGNSINNEGTGNVDVYNGTISNTNSSGSSIHNNSTGVVTVFDGTIKASRNCISNGNENGKIYIEGGNIGGNPNSSSRSSVGIYITKGYLKMTGGTINNVDNGIEITGTSSSTDVTDIIIEAANITASQCGIKWSNYYDTHTLNLTLGVKDGIVDNDNSPLNIYSIGTYAWLTNYGIWANKPDKANLKYYDGIITGNIDKAMNITPLEVEDGYDIIKTTENNKEILKLEIAVLAKNISKNPNKDYSNIQTAINDAASGEIIQIQRDKKLITTETFNIPADKNIVIDLNGKIISVGVEKQIVNNGTLRITDSSTGDKGGLISTTNYLVHNKGTLVLDSGNYSSTGHIIENEGSLTVNNDAAISSTAIDAVGIYNNNSTVTFNNGIIDLTSNDFYRTTVSIENYGNSASTTINNGRISPVVRNDNSGTVVIDGGTFDGKTGICVHNKENGVITITGGTFNTSFDTRTSLANAIYNESSGTIHFSNGTVNPGSCYGITNNADGIININSGIISNSWNHANSVYNKGSGSINILGGTITSESNIAIRNESTGGVNITGGTISGTTGVLNYGTGELIIGVKDGEPNPGEPSITGTSSYGVSSANKEFSFYGGTITGTNDPSVNGGIEEYDTNCDLVRVDNGDGTETSTLQKNLKLAKNLRTNTEYADMASAVNAAQNGDTLQIQRHKIYSSNEDIITIPSGKNISIDLKGYEIYFVKDNGITNNGTLTILDSSDNNKGLLKSYKNSTINNNGTLNIQNGTIEGAYQKITDNTVDLAGGNAILNAGTINMTGGNVKSISTAITNIGTLNGNGGTLNAVASIYNNEGGIINTLSTSSIMINGTYGIINNSDIGNITYNGGTISTTTQGLRNIKTCEIKIGGGTIETTGRSDCAILNEGTGTIEIDGEVRLSSHGELVYGMSGGIPYPGNTLYNSNSGKIKVSNADIKLTNYGNASSNNSAGEIEIDNCTVTGSVIQSQSGTIKILNNSVVNGQISVNGNNSTTIIEDSSVTHSNQAVFNVGNNSTVKLINATITNTGGGNAVDNYGGNSIMEIIGGTIKSEGDNTTGIHNVGTLTIGNKDLIYDANYPDIYGKEYGIYNENNATFNFYDGIIKSGNKAISGTVSEVEDDYKLSITNVEKEAILTPSGTTQAVATIGSMNFMSLQLAVDSITTGTIDIRTDIDLSAPVNIPTGKNITINKNGYSVTYNGSSANAFNIESGATLTINN